MIPGRFCRSGITAKLRTVENQLHPSYGMGAEIRVSDLFLIITSDTSTSTTMSDHDVLVMTQHGELGFIWLLCLDDDDDDDV